MRRELDTTVVDLGEPFMPVRGRQIHHSDALLAQQRIELCNRRYVAWPPHHNRRASQQRWKNLFHADIERQRSEVQHAIAGRKLVTGSGSNGMICKRAV